MRIIVNSYILGDPGADSGDEGKSKRVEKCGPKKSKERRARRAHGDNVLPDQFQTLAAVLAFDWCQKTCVFLAPINLKKKPFFSTFK